MGYQHQIQDQQAFYNNHSLSLYQQQHSQLQLQLQQQQQLQQHQLLQQLQQQQLQQQQAQQAQQTQQQQQQQQQSLKAPTNINNNATDEEEAKEEEESRTLTAAASMTLQDVIFGTSSNDNNDGTPNTIIRSIGHVDINDWSGQMLLAICRGAAAIRMSIPHPKQTRADCIRSIIQQRGRLSDGSSGSHSGVLQHQTVKKR